MATRTWVCLHRGDLSSDVEVLDVHGQFPSQVLLVSHHSPFVNVDSKAAHTMFSRTATIASVVGLHARPATDFSRMIAASGIPVSVGRPDGTRVNGASVLAVMALGIKCGERVVLHTEDAGSEHLLDDLVGFLETEHAVASAPPMSGYPLPAA